MLRAIDRFIRKAYAPLLMGMPLFFITVSPYSNKDAKEKKRTQKSFKEITADSQQLVQSALEGDMLMPDSEDPEVALYNLYLTKAAVPSPFMETAPNKEFLPLSSEMQQSVPQEVTYTDLLEAYLDKVEYMIDIEKDYFNALMELDKVMMIAPHNQKAKYLRTKLKQKLKGELENVKKRRSSTMTPAMEQVIDIKEKALLEAEKKLLTEALETKPYQAKVKAEEAIVENALDEHKKAVPEQIKEKKEEVAAPKAMPRKHRDVVIVKNENIIKIKATKTQSTDRSVEVSEKSDDVLMSIEETLPLASKPVEKSAPAGLETEVVSPQVIEVKVKENATHAVKKRDHLTVLEDHAKKYLLRGKRYYRDGNFALALISLSKAKQFDAEQRYSIEIEQLINMTRSRLEAIANEG